jgi:P2-related tail formation protein
MATHVDLLPGNAPPWARLFGETIDPRRSLGTGYENIYFAGEVVPPQFVPWLIWQLGLAELTPYVPSIGQLISEGVAWQRVRGTPSAIGLSLSWLGYAATLHEAASRRKKWHRFQIELDRVRDADLPDLARIYGVVSLSPPARSRFTRGFRGYDIRAAETSYQRTSASLTSDHSGVYIPGVDAKWSFGRRYETTHGLTARELDLMGAWVEPDYSSGLWVSDGRLWSSANLTWDAPAIQARRTTMAGAIASLGIPYARFRRPNGSIIGHQIAFQQPVLGDITGNYLFGGTYQRVDATAVQSIIAWARTDFGSGAGETCNEVSFVFGGQLVSGVDPGKRWVAANELVGGVEVAAQILNVQMGLTVREHVLALMSLEGATIIEEIEVGDGDLMTADGAEELNSTTVSAYPIDEIEAEAGFSLAADGADELNTWSLD